MENPDDREPPGLWLRRQRAAAGLTQEDLAERSGVTARTIGNLERGRAVKPHPGSVRQVAAALGLSHAQADELITRYRNWARSPGSTPAGLGPAGLGPAGLGPAGLGSEHRAGLEPPRRRCHVSSPQRSGTSQGARPSLKPWPGCWLMTARRTGAQ